MFKQLVVILFSLSLLSPAFAEEQTSHSLFIVHFQAGPNWNDSLTPQQQTKFKEHAKNLNSLRKQKRISFGARYAEFGVIVVKGESLKQVKTLIENDPGVKAGIFTFNIEALSVFYRWQE